MGVGMTGNVRTLRKREQFKRIGRSTLKEGDEAKGRAVPMISWFEPQGEGEPKLILEETEKT